VSQLAPASRLSKFAADRLIQHNLVVAGGTVSAGLLGFAFQALISHHLSPANYGATFAVMTLLTVSWLPASAVTLVMAREASRDRAEGRTDHSAALLRSGNRLLLIIGLGLATFLVLASNPLARFLEVPAGLILPVALAMPFGMALPLLLGELQGQQRFVTFSGIATGQAALKIAAAMILGALLGPFGVLAGISFATALAYLAGLLVLLPTLRAKPSQVEWRRVLDYLTLILPSTLALSVLFGADILIVKHFFSAQLAGQYAAVSALGKAIFWGASGVAAVLFPKVILREARGSTGNVLVVASLMLAAAGGILGLIILSIWSAPLLTVFAGSAYAGGAALLAWYALGMTLLGTAAVLVATQQSRGRARFLFILVPAALFEPGLITLFHGSLIQVIAMVDLSAGALLAGLGILYLVEETKRAPMASFAAILPAASPNWVGHGVLPEELTRGRPVEVNH